MLKVQLLTSLSLSNSTGRLCASPFLSNTHFCTPAEAYTSLRNERSGVITILPHKVRADATECESSESCIRHAQRRAARAMARIAPPHEPSLALVQRRR